MQTSFSWSLLSQKPFWIHHNRMTFLGWFVFSDEVKGHSRNQMDSNEKKNRLKMDFTIEDEEVGGHLSVSFLQIGPMKVTRLESDCIVSSVPKSKLINMCSSQPQQQKHQTATHTNMYTNMYTYIYIYICVSISKYIYISIYISYISIRLRIVLPPPRWPMVEVKRMRPRHLRLQFPQRPPRLGATMKSGS